MLTGKVTDTMDAAQCQRGDITMSATWHPAVAMTLRKKKLSSLVELHCCHIWSKDVNETFTLDMKELYQDQKKKEKKHFLITTEQQLTGRPVSITCWAAGAVLDAAAAGVCPCDPCMSQPGGFQHPRRQLNHGPQRQWVCFFTSL